MRSTSDKKTEKLNFSDVVTFEKLQSDLKKNNALCYVSGTGSGKSYWVTNVLDPRGKVLFVTSRRAKVEEDAGKGFFDTSLDNYRNPKKSFLVTNSSLAQFIKKLPFSAVKPTVDTLLDNVQYIVVDEIHSIVCDSSFATDVFTVQKFIEYAAFEKKKNVILLTATVQLIEAYLENPIGQEGCKWYCQDFTKECISTFPKDIITINGSALEVAVLPSFANDEKKSLYFVTTETQAKGIAAILTKSVADKKATLRVTNPLKTSQILIYTSPKREEARKLKEELSEQLKNKDKNADFELFLNADGNILVKDLTEGDKALEKRLLRENNQQLLSILYISQQQKLPPHIKVLLATSALREGVNLKDEDFSRVIIDSHSLSDLIQYMGRVREANYTLYIKNNGYEFSNDKSDVGYEYSGSDGVSSANRYIESLTDSDKKLGFIRYMEKLNQYVRFNYIEQKFELNILLYRYQAYLSLMKEPINQSEDCPVWQCDLFRFFRKFGIDVQAFDIAETAASNISVMDEKNLLSLYKGKNGLWMDSNSWKEVKKQTELIFNLKKAPTTVEKINETFKKCFEKIGYSFYLESVKNRTKADIVHSQEKTSNSATIKYRVTLKKIKN